MRKLVLLSLVLACAAWPSAAAAFSVSGAAQFPVIHGPEDPEEYTWELKLDEDQTLEQVDDRHVAVRYEGGVTAFVISAESAHDATGVDVPTTLAVTGPNLVTLTVHHLAGNPAAAAPFTYPISAGPGWEGGFQTATIAMPPPEAVIVDPARCHVPDLDGRSLKASRKLLRKSGCKLGPVRGERAKGAGVVKQYRKPGRSLPAGTAVGVKLG